MIQEQRHTQEVRQEQTMGHQQIQALEMLASPICDLQTMISTELARNPLLELEKVEEDYSLPTEESLTDESSSDDDSWMDSLMRIDDETPLFERQVAYVSAEEEERRRHYFESIATHKTLQDDLQEQVHFLDLSPCMRRCCELVVAAVDDFGYCDSHPADLAMASGESLATVEEALRHVQSLEPAGVAARDLRERLMIQLERQGAGDSQTYLVVSKYFDDLAHNRLPTLSRKLRIPVGELQQVLDQIRQLKPALDLDQYQPAVECVEAEVEILEHQGELEIQYLRDQLPSLRINAQYKRLLADPGTRADTREYIKQKMRAAAHMIHNLALRQRTLDRIIQTIVELQREFFLHGKEYMKPMTMSQVAQHIDVHETTVSRGVASKYMRCKYGLIPLRNFFTSGYQDEGGKSISNTVVKERIRELIEKEDRVAPLSDGRIAEEIQRFGFRVARRTVAKYRESLKILPCNQRRLYV